MTTERSRLTDYDIERFLRTRTADPDPSLWNDILATSATARQRSRPWTRWPTRRRLAVLLVAGLLLVAVAGAVGVGSGLFRPVPPVRETYFDQALVFDRPFDYATPVDSSSLALTRRTSGIYRFEDAARGVVVFAVRPGSVTHDCRSGTGRGRTVISGTPAEVLDNLRLIGGLGIGAASPTTLDGIPALSASVDPSFQQDPDSECEGSNDIHVQGMPAFADYVPFERRARLIFADVEGLVVGVQIWTNEPDDLDAWIPTAMEFVETFHFLPPEDSVP